MLRGILVVMPRRPMLTHARAVLALLLTLLPVTAALAACGSSRRLPAGTSASTSPTSAAPALAADGRRLFDDRGLRFEYPPIWNSYEPVDQDNLFNYVAFLSSVPTPIGRCVGTTDAADKSSFATCDVPHPSLTAGGVLVTWQAVTGVPVQVDVAAADYTTVAGHPAEVDRSALDPSCTGAIGAATSVRALLAGSAGFAPTLMIACIGPGPTADADTADVDRMLATLTLGE